MWQQLTADGCLCLFTPFCSKDPWVSPHDLDAEAGACITDVAAAFGRLALAVLFTPSALDNPGRPPHHIHSLLHNRAIDQEIGPDSHTSGPEELQVGGWAEAVVAA